jgi:Raf kinase inhibitor-like YbhB/YbcL family protein
MTNVTSKLALSSGAFDNGGPIPRKFTCDGEDVSPDLSWSGAPDGTDTFALIVDDPDAPGRTFTHWVVYNVPAAMSGIDEGMSAFDIVKAGASQGKNDFGQAGYGGPCPPRGKPHHYHFRLYALDSVLDIPSGVSKGAVLAALKGHVLADTEIVGLYQRA